MRRLVLASSLSVAMAFALQAQETPRITYDFGAGFTQGVGRTGSNLDTGWNVQGGPTYNIFPFLGVKLDVGYNSFGVNSGTLTGLGLQSGNFNVLSATVNPILRLRPKSRIDPYLVAGYGVYHYTQSFAQPVGASGTPFSPFFGGFLSNEYSATHGGFDAGAGVEFASKGRWKVYGEARYNRILSSYGQHFDYLPVTFGVRF